MTLPAPETGGPHDKPDGNREVDPVALRRAGAGRPGRDPHIPTKKSETFDAVDLVTFRNGRIVDFRQMTDTALVKSLAA